jgi:pyrroline-5-carboxylate reductase
MGEAMIRGILDRGLAKVGDIAASDISEERRSYLKKNYGVATVSDNRSTVEKAEVIVLAVLPVSLPEVMIDLKGFLQTEQLVLSIVARKTLASLCHGLDHKAVVRAMPNISAQIGEGVSVWTAASEVKEEQKQKARSILSVLGKEIFVSDERYVDMATAVSGSGPAYIFLVIEALIDAAVHIGLPRELAQELVLETISGATHLAQRSAKHPAELRNLVTTPGGTTAQGLLRLEADGLRGLLVQAIVAAYEKAKALGGE